MVSAFSNVGSLWFWCHYRVSLPHDYVIDASVHDVSRVDVHRATLTLIQNGGGAGEATWTYWEILVGAFVEGEAGVVKLNEKVSDLNDENDVMGRVSGSMMDLDDRDEGIGSEIDWANVDDHGTCRGPVEVLGCTGHDRGEQARTVGASVGEIPDEAHPDQSPFCGVHDRED